MTCEEIIIKLQSKASKKHKANVVRMGIPEDYSIGVSTAIIRSIAKEIEKSNELASLCDRIVVVEKNMLYNKYTTIT